MEGGLLLLGVGIPLMAWRKPPELCLIWQALADAVCWWRALRAWEGGRGSEGGSDGGSMVRTREWAAVRDGRERLLVEGRGEGGVMHGKELMIRG